MSFQSDFDVRHLPEGRKYLLREFVFNDPEHGKVVVYPEYLTGRRVRRRPMLWPTIQRLSWGRADRAETIRDYLYNGGIVHCNVPNKKEADEIFHRAMIAEGVPKWRRITLYNYVRLFGRPLWKGWSK